MVHYFRRLLAVWLVGLAGSAACTVRFTPQSGSVLADSAAETVSYSGSKLNLRGYVYRPEGSGPFPAILYNHGSARGMLSDQAFQQLGPLFAHRGWLFFAPYRRGQGLSEAAGAYIGDQIDAAIKHGGVTEGAATMIRLLRTDHLEDQLAALAWLKKQTFVDGKRIAVMGNSFGGIETVFGVEQVDYCAAIDASGGAQSWALAPQLQDTMLKAVRNSRAPIFFFQAQNDYDLSPSATLAKAMLDAGKVAVVKIYPPYGTTAEEGHSFTYRGGSIWSADVFSFLDQHCKKTGPKQHAGSRRK